MRRPISNSGGVSVRLIAEVCTLLISTPALSSFIVHTGTPEPSPSGSTVSANQWLAGQFSLSSYATITDIEDFIGCGIVNETFCGTFHIGLASDSSGPPGAEFFSAHSAIYAPLSAWVGAYGLSIDLDAGTYLGRVFQPTRRYGAFGTNAASRAISTCCGSIS